MSVRSQIAAIANAEYPREACGFVLGIDRGVVVQCVNVADDPVNTFRIDPGDVAAWWETEQVTAVWHSHPRATAVPSEIDESVAREADLAWDYLIYSVVDEDLGWYKWDGEHLSLTTMESPE